MYLITRTETPDKVGLDLHYYGAADTLEHAVKWIEDMGAVTFYRECGKVGELYGGLVYKVVTPYKTLYAVLFQPYIYNGD